MPCLKIVPEPYETYEDTYTLIHRYIYPKSVCIGGLAVDPVNAADHMEFYRISWGKTTGARVRHFVLSYDDMESEKIHSCRELESIAYEICDYYKDSYQIIFGIHQFPRWHIHFVMNTLNYRTGRKYRRNKQDDNELREVIYWTIGAAVPVFYN